MPRRTVLVSGLISLAAAVPLIAAAAPAEAAGTCPSGFVCVFENGDFNGGRYMWHENDLDQDFNAATAITFTPGTTKVNDHISSIMNHTSRTVQFCVDSYFRGACVNYSAGYDYKSISNNDKYSSVRFP